MNPIAERVFKDLKESFSDPNELCTFPVEEVGSIILSVIDSDDAWRGSGYGHVSVNSFIAVMGEAYGGRLDEVVQNHVATAWQFLLSECMVVPLPDTNGQNGCVFITDKGLRCSSSESMEGYLRVKDLPLRAIHQSIQDKIYPLFIRGDYDTAVFQAFKEVEVSVREAAGYEATDYGVDMMRRAFNKDNGSLTDATLPSSERQSIQDLFAGAMGTFKNPQSHRHVGIISPEEAAEMIMLASYLLRIVDRKVNSSTEGTQIIEEYVK